MNILIDDNGDMSSRPTSEWPELGVYKNNVDLTDKTPRRYSVETALALLLTEDILLLLPTQTPAGPVLSVFINCNDVFGPFADCEPVSVPVDYEADHEFWSLYDLTRKWGARGALVWVAKRRKSLPWRKQRWKAAGFWPDELAEIEAEIDVKNRQ